MIDKSISIVIPNYNGKDVIKGCLDSVYKQNGIKFEIIVVDDKSTDISPEFLEDEFKAGKIKLIKNNINGGFSKSCNVGAAAANYPFIMFLNSDVILEGEEHLSKTVNFFNSDDSIGVLGCFQRNLDLSPQFIGSNVDIFLNLNPRYSNKEFMINILKNNKERFLNVFMTGGACFTVKREVFNKVGGFDQDYYLYGEELDLMWRIRMLNYKIVTSVDLPIIHLGGCSTGNAYNNTTNYKKIYYRERNSLITMLKNYSIFSLLTVLPIYFIFQIPEILYSMISGNFRVVRSYFRSNFYIVMRLKDIASKREVVQNMKVVQDKALFKHKEIVFSSFKILHILMNGVPKIK